MTKAKKRLLTLLLAMLMAVGMAVPTFAVAPEASAFRSTNRAKSVQVYTQASTNILKSVSQNKAPEVCDLMLAMKAADSSKVIVGNVDQNVADQINENFVFSGVGILTEATEVAGTYDLSNDEKMYVLDLYQFEDEEGLISPAEALAAARSRPMTDTYQDGMDEYHVTGAVRINLVYKEEPIQDEITITQVSAMTSWTGSVRTTKLVMVAVVSQGFNTYTHRIPNPVSNPSQNRWYSMQTDFVEEGLYNNLGLITD